MKRLGFVSGIFEELRSTEMQVEQTITTMAKPSIRRVLTKFELPNTPRYTELIIQLELFFHQA